MPADPLPLLLNRALAQIDEAIRLFSELHLKEQLQSATDALTFSRGSNGSVSIVHLTFFICD
jgi:hypothetical protein